MGRLRNYYSWLQAALGIFVPVSAVVMMAFRGAGLVDILLIALSIPAGWLRIKLEPSGYLTLAPAIIFAGLLLTSPYVPLLIATVAAFVSSRFARSSWLVTLQEMGEEGSATLVSAILIAWLRSSPNWSLSLVTVRALLVAALSYASIRLFFVAARANLFEGIGFRYTVFSTGRIVLVNSLVFAVVSLVMTYLVNAYGNVGYFALALATVTLVELYHPYKLLSEQKDTLFASLAIIAQAIDLKDPYTAKHSSRVADTAVRVARTIGLPESEVRQIRVGALMHDIGKTGISGSIIRKPTQLEPHETSIMREHPVISANIMQPIELLTDAAEIVRHHHEHYDGSGYPDGLKGGEIPIGSRVILVADAFDAMTTDRPYRRGRSKQEAMGILREHAGRQFDPQVVSALESVIELV